MRIVKVLNSKCILTNELINDIIGGFPIKIETEISLLFIYLKIAKLYVII